VAAITEATIRELAGIRGQGAPITSCYLDIDGRRLARPRAVEIELEALMRTARAQANGHASVRADLAKIERFVRAGIDRSRTRGIAIFACDADDLWRVIELPVRVQSRVVINSTPAVGQLESVLQDHERIGVLLADRQQARLFVFELGEVVERSELFDELPRDYDSRGERERGDTHHHLDALAQQHLKHVAQVAWTMYQETGFAHLGIGAADAIASELERYLHPYLRDRVCGRVSLGVTATHDEIRAAAEVLEGEVEREREARVVARLREAVATGGKGAAGLAAVLAALATRRVEQLVVSCGYSEAGWRCEPCQRLAAVGRTCKECGAEMAPVDDVVEEAVDTALDQAIRVEMTVGNADLDVLGRIGALLRY
jgi:peptide subunit release factor 1 (eRF1)